MKGTLRFEPRLDKIRKDHKTLLRLSYSLLDQRKRVNTDILIYPFLWDNKRQEVVSLKKAEANAKAEDPARKLIVPEMDKDLLPLGNDLKNLNRQIDDVARAFEKIENTFIE